MRWTMALLLTMRRCVALRAPAHRLSTALLDSDARHDQWPADAATVDWRGLRAEAARRLDRATKKIAKKSAKAKTLPESVEALKKTEAERDRLRELVDALNAVDGSAEALTLANALGVRDAPPPRQPRVGRVSRDAVSAPRRTQARAQEEEGPVEHRAAPAVQRLRQRKRRRDPRWKASKRQRLVELRLSVSGRRRLVAARRRVPRQPRRDSVARRQLAIKRRRRGPRRRVPRGALLQSDRRSRRRAASTRPLARVRVFNTGAARLQAARREARAVALKGDVTTIRVDLGAEGKRLKRLMATKDAVK